MLCPSCHTGLNVCSAWSSLEKCNAPYQRYNKSPDSGLMFCVRAAKEYTALSSLTAIFGEEIRKQIAI